MPFKRVEASLSRPRFFCGPEIALVCENSRCPELHARHCMYQSYDGKQKSQLLLAHRRPIQDLSCIGTSSFRGSGHARSIVPEKSYLSTTEHNKEQRARGPAENETSTHVVARCRHQVRLCESHRSFVKGRETPSVQSALVVREGYCLPEPASRTGASTC